MPLDGRKVAHIAANREKIRAGRAETVVFVSAAADGVSYAAAGGCVWFEAGAVPAGVSTRSGDISRTPYDAMAEFPNATVFPAGLRVIARTATPTSAAVAAAERFTILDARRAGLGTTGSGGATNTGNRWLVRLRRLR